MEKRHNKWKITAISFMILSFLLFTLYFFTLIGFIAIENEYEDMIQRWCNIANDDVEIINNLLDSLEYYDQGWKEVERLEKVNCFG